MRFAPLGDVRVAIVADRSFAPHLPSACEWARLELLECEGAQLGPALDRAAALSPAVTVIVQPHEFPAADVARLPGLKIGVVASPLGVAADAAPLRALAAPDLGDRRVRWFTTLEAPPPGAELPVLMTFPLPVDTGRCLAAPRLEASRVLVPAWASPPRTTMERLRAIAPVDVLPFEADPATWDEHLAGAGVVVAWSAGVLGRLDPLPVRALANGLLLVANREFPADWGIEVEDEYLVRPDPDALAKAVEEAVRTPLTARAVRVRAWQRVRECFAAGDAFHRLVHDALLLADPAAAASRLAAAGGRHREPPSRPRLVRAASDE